MYVCICHAITDKQIQNEVYQGAKCLKSLQKNLPVGTGCGTCVCLAQEVIAETLCELKHQSQNQVA
jgi:bacterioferritin-associated ferredoxin